ncbi:hypothetical protein HGRIS_009002 [Hohenbuehelia grisea]|uniref:Uncharacterized protein n=1 Tax=Hohenbuehelia grisea TaxID=104357 RepID=A0ABR3IZT6_9AGAR
MAQFIDRLTPPADTSFFSSFDQQVLGQTSILGQGSNAAQVSWSVTFYTYATGANPSDSNFVGEGGEVYIVAVHKGFVTVPDDSYGKIRFGVTFVPNSGNHQMETVADFPGPDSGTKQGSDHWSYNVDFTQTFSMFQDGGNQPFEFSAQYANTVRRKGVKQHDEGQGVFSLVASDSGSIPQGDYELLGLTLFKHNTLSDWPIQTILWVEGWKDANQFANDDPAEQQVVMLPLGLTYASGAGTAPAPAQNV